MSLPTIIWKACQLAAGVNFIATKGSIISDANWAPALGGAIAVALFASVINDVITAARKTNP